MISKKIAALIAGKKLNTLSIEEEELLLAWRKEAEQHEMAYQYAMNKTDWYRDLQTLETIDVNKAVDSVLERILRTESKKMKPRYWWRYAGVAAAVLLVLLSVLWKYRETAVEIVPGGNKAILKLADGTSLQLSEGQHELVISDELLYGDGSGVEGVTKEQRADAMMEIVTPKGGEYTVILADKTKIILNAASKLRFPKVFSMRERLVELEGEAYFEVNKTLTPAQQPQPFLVKTKQQTVQVLGTQFNISAYAEDKSTYTTLVEGKVAVSAEHRGAKVQQLIPGQQAINNGTGAIEVKAVDVFNYTSWTKNQFVFASEPLGAAMQKLARWYDMEYVFEKESLKNERIEGILPRYASLEELLELMKESLNLRFRVVGKQVYIY
ncbi:FecR family protein [Sphingobacterium yanglingense]|uniref:FecR family protein n=1 Tax=Sphingobacterium yanglingense TaxID=1437280 RepID=A0A4R6W7N4_9SPHI|nr:FecR domain-containing protein [Sphingobacterium yanglingense]TDQ73526.1 FecR family protein [Sphingobacterium yanglingense]